MLLLIKFLLEFIKIVKESDSKRKKKMEVQNLFANSRLNITAEGKRHLGAVIGRTEYRDEHVEDLVKETVEIEFINSSKTTSELATLQQFERTLQINHGTFTPQVFSINSSMGREC